FVVQMALFYAAPAWGWGRGLAGLGALSFGILLAGWRWLGSRLQPGPVTRWPTAILGGGPEARAIAEVIRARPEHAEAYELQGYLDDGGASIPGLARLGEIGEIAAIVAERRVRLLVVAQDHMPPSLVEALLACKARGVRIVDMPTLYKQLT